MSLFDSTTDDYDDLRELALELSDFDPFDVETNQCVFCKTFKSTRNHHQWCLWRRACAWRWRSSSWGSKVQK